MTSLSPECLKATFHQGVIDDDLPTSFMTNKIDHHQTFAVTTETSKQKHEVCTWKCTVVMSYSCLCFTLHPLE